MKGSVVVNSNISINSVNSVNTQNTTSFGARRIDKINLLKKTSAGYTDIIKSDFLELSSKNAKDLDFMAKLRDLWTGKVEYIKQISTGFFQHDPTSCFFVNQINLKDGKKVTSLMQTTNPKMAFDKEKFYVHFLQSAPEIANKKHRSPIKGSGEISLYEAVKMAKKNKYKELRIISSNNNYYKRLGLEEVELCGDGKGGVYRITKDKYNDFIDKVRKKYSL